jgi:drug/metabolite transporter (DMT)-like permease
MVEFTKSLKAPQGANHGSTSPRILVVGGSLAAVYLIWGSTYLAIRFGLEGFPPFLLSGIRFSVAGVLMYTVLRLRGTPAPTRRHWWNAARVGMLMLVGGVGLVTMAEHVGVGSGVAATAVAVIPLWAALVSGLFGSWPARLEWVGLVLGFGGVIVLAQEGDFGSNPLGMALVVIAPILWAIGSVWGSHLELPRPAMATAIQLLVGGSVMLALGPLRGERIPEIPPASAWFALGYLIVFGSIVAYTAYVYLLQTVRPSLATSYAYANPIVAVVLGVTLGSEVLTGPALIALPLILAGVGLVLLGPRRTQKDREGRCLPADRRILTTRIGGRSLARHPRGAQPAGTSARRPNRRLRSLTGRVFTGATLPTDETSSPGGGRR